MEICFQFVFDTRNRPSLELDEKVAKQIGAGQLLGKSKPPLVHPPEKIVNALTHVLCNCKARYTLNLLHTTCFWHWFSGHFYCCKKFLRPRQGK